MTLGYTYRHEIPIYLQLIDIMRSRIIEGDYCAGDRLPSIRDMALEYEVTPNTIQRALAVFEQEDIILTERTNGKYITSDLQRIRDMRQEHLRFSIHTLLEDLAGSGYTHDEIRLAFEKEMASDDNR